MQKKKKYINFNNETESGNIFLLKAAFAIVPTDKMCGRNLSLKIPVDMNIIFMKLCVTWPTRPKVHIPQKFEFSKGFFIVFRLMKNIIFNKTESFVEKKTSACQIFCSKSNWSYVSLIFPPRDNRGQNNGPSECLLRP